MITLTERRHASRGTMMARGLLASLALTSTALLLGCGHHHDHESHAPEAQQSWAITAWGQYYEVFPEVGSLVAGQPAEAVIHVTALEGFEPLADGEVEWVLTGASGEQTFVAESPVRPGVFSLELTPQQAGDFDFSLRIRGDSGLEELRGGRMRVGDGQQPGRLLMAPAPKGGSGGGEPLEFFKEQQWGSDFETAWVRRGAIASSYAGLAKIRPPATGEAVLTSPLAGVVRGAQGTSSWPFVGRNLDRGQAVFRVIPRVAADRSLPRLEADWKTLETQLRAAEARRERLEELLQLEAVSLREVGQNRVKIEELSARRDAAQRSLQAARALREGQQSAEDLLLRAPFDGVIAAVDVTPGTTVEAGQVLGRIVAAERMWMEVQLAPAAARNLVGKEVRGVVLSDPSMAPLRLEEELRVISIAPEVSPATGTVSVLLEAPRPREIALGTTLEAQVLSADLQEGVVIPASAVLDDGGVSVVYLQLAGERFLRQQVRVLERQGSLALVDGLSPGQRLVTRGGEAIRRASLMVSGVGHGHVH